MNPKSLLLVNKEIVHYHGNNTFIASKFNKVYYALENKTEEIELPISGLKKLIGRVRLIRRLLRLDKCNVYPTISGLVILYQHKGYFYDFEHKVLKEVLILRNCRNILHQAIAKAANGYLYFGEYGTNMERKAVPIYRSMDNGRSWQIVYEFQPGVIRHVHSCTYDPYEDKVWICTGDFGTENKIAIADYDFQNIEIVGDGSQKYRTCNFFFEKDEVHWLMDSQLETSFHLKMRRSDRKVTELDPLPGPVWYSKKTKKGYYAATAQEIGPGVKDAYSHILFSKDLANWTTVRKHIHDFWPRKYFKSGVIGFSEGEAEDGFYLFFEALKGIDGKSEKWNL